MRRKTKLMLSIAALLSISCVAATPANASVRPDYSAEAAGVQSISNTGDSPSTFPAALKRSILRPNASPAGANDWNCKPSAAHPRPVVLVHGTYENAYNNWSGLAPILASKGYCVYALNYGRSTALPINGTGDIALSAAELGRFVERVTASTGASKVDIIGHSQGGSMSRYYTNILGGSAKVNSLIALAASNHPITFGGIRNLTEALGVSGLGYYMLNNVMNFPGQAQQIDPNSAFFRTLNGNGETRPGVNYINIATKTDQVVTPYTAAFLTPSGNDQVTNITLQDKCNIDNSDHLSLSYSKNVAQLVLNHLQNQPNAPITCHPQQPLTGSAK